MASTVFRPSASWRCRRPLLLLRWLRYLVRPNQGVVRPAGQLTVSIVLLAQDKR